FLNLWIAQQIRALREQRGWTQATLAGKAQMKQSRISTLEDPNYSSWSVTTLKRLARAFDVALAVEFRAYGKRLIDFDRFERRDLGEVGFEDDLAFRPTTAVSSSESPAMPSQPEGSSAISVLFSSQQPTSAHFALVGDPPEPMRGVPWK